MIKKLSIKESSSLQEQDVEIEVKNKGVLEVPEGKSVDELPIKHFVDIANRKSLGTVTRALNNLQVWNKNTNKQLSKWAGDMIDKVTKRYENQKKESIYRRNVSKHTQMNEFFNRDEINRLISDMEVIGYEYKGTDNRGRLIFDSWDGNSTQAFPDWDDVKDYLENGSEPFELEDCYIKESYLPDWQDTIEKEVYNVLNNNHISADVYEDSELSDNDLLILCVEINDGDWKHEHRRADILISDLLSNYDNLDITNLGTTVTEEDGSDTYSGIHKFYILKTDEVNKDTIKDDDIEKRSLDIKFLNDDSINESCHSKKSTVKEDKDFEQYTYIKSKEVYDSDGWRTEYTMYFDEVYDRYVFVFGDSDLYDPNDGYEEFDWECDTEQEANEWFNDYEGFDEDLDESCNLKEETNDYMRYMVKLTPYKNMYQFRYIDNYFDKSDYCFCDENGYVETQYSGLTKKLFDKLWDKDMESNAVYGIYTDGPNGEVLYYKEIPTHWFK